MARGAKPSESMTIPLGTIRYRKEAWFPEGGSAGGGVKVWVWQDRSRPNTTTDVLDTRKY